VKGKLLGRGTKSDRYLFAFPDVTFEPGEIKAVADNGDKPLASDSVQTASEPVALRLTPITSPNGLCADGSDIALIDVEAIDESGQRCPTFDQRVDFSCDGPAIWRGGYNSGRADSINQKFLDLESGINRVAVRSTLTSGDISVTATCPGLKSASVVIPAHAFEVENGYSQVMPATPAVVLSKTRPDWSLLAVATPPMTVTTATENNLAAGHFIETFNYTGPTELVHVEVNAADGKNVYCDRDYSFRNLPAKLSGADWVQAADADKFYVAQDLMQLAVKAGTTAYIAHDARLPIPDWLQRQFVTTGLSFTVAGRPMKIFVRHSQGDESYTLGSNGADYGIKSCNMYVVFVKSGNVGNTASR
jgi:beta-galactosidase